MSKSVESVMANLVLRELRAAPAIYFQCVTEHMLTQFFQHCFVMRFVPYFTPPDFQATNLKLAVSPNFNSFCDKNTKNE